MKKKVYLKQDMYFHKNNEKCGNYYIYLRTKYLIKLYVNVCTDMTPSPCLDLDGPP